MTDNIVQTCKYSTVPVAFGHCGTRCIRTRLCGSNKKLRSVSLIHIQYNAKQTHNLEKMTVPQYVTLAVFSSREPTAAGPKTVRAMFRAMGKRRQWQANMAPSSLLRFAIDDTIRLVSVFVNTIIPVIIAVVKVVKWVDAAVVVLDV
jgi:hypothetical protein